MPQTASAPRRPTAGLLFAGILTFVGCSAQDSGGERSATPLAWQTSEPLQASDAQPKDRFGFSVSIAGPVAVVGAIGHEHSGMNGSAYAFRLTTTGWQQDPIELQPNDAAGNVDIGVSVSASGQRVAVGSGTAGTALGGAWVFEQVGAGWMQSGNKLEAFAGDVAYTPTAADGFGAAVALDGDDLLVGAPYASVASDGDDCGAVFYFHWEGSAWVGKQVLHVGSMSAAGGEFGGAVAIHGNFVAVGASTDAEVADGAGAAYYFAREDDVWIKKQKLTGNDAGDTTPVNLVGASFGWAVAISNQVLAVGAPFEGTSRGAALVFDRARSDQPFAFADKYQLVPPNGNEQTGFAIAVSDTHALVGSPTAPSNGPFDSGQAVLLDRASEWNVEFPLYPPPIAPTSFFGGSLAMQTKQVIVGAAEDDEQRGSAFISALARGQGCDSPLDCETGFCVEDVCCDTACEDNCSSCLADRKQGGTTGTCGPIAADTDPKGGCGPDANERCGFTGSCDGAGSCAIQPDGVECEEASCSGNTAQAASVCDGKRHCVPPPARVCPPGYACRKGDCAQKCQSDEQCDLENGFGCAGGACGVVRGGQCQHDSDCVLDDQCSRGSCCDAKCDGPCQQCDASGICRNALDGPSPECSVGNVCHDGACLSETWCSDDATRELHADGTERPCNNARCVRGSCIERCTKSQEDCASGYVCRQDTSMCILDQPQSHRSPSLVCTTRLPKSPTRAHAAWACLAALAWTLRRRRRRNFPIPSADPS